MARGRPRIVQVKRVYEPPSPDDGGRVLVDRVWPRGISRERMQIDAWLPDLGPSPELRKWFGHDPEKWKVFRQRYLRELEGKKPVLRDLARHARAGKLTLVYGARNPLYNQAVVIKEVLERRI